MQPAQQHHRPLTSMENLHLVTLMARVDRGPIKFMSSKVSNQSHSLYLLEKDEYLVYPYLFQHLASSFSPFFILSEERSTLFKLSLTVSKLSSFKARNKYKHKLIAMDTDTRNVSLVGIQAFTNVEHGGEKNAKLFFTPENKRYVRRCLLEIIIQHQATFCNMFNLAMLGDVASTCCWASI